MELGPGVSVLVGGNGQGKTSLMEAIYSLSIARAFRVENECEVISWAVDERNPHTLVAGVITKGEEEITIFIGYRPASTIENSRPASSHSDTFRVRKEIRVSRVKRTSAELIGLVNAVLFTADDIALILGPPSLRRKYMDILISQTDRNYLKSLQRYQRILQRRNKLLRVMREQRSADEELYFWSSELAKEGAFITHVRSEVMDSLMDSFSSNHSELALEFEALLVRYAPSVPLAGPNPDVGVLEQTFLSELQSQSEKEKTFGMTLIGPHRDDFRILLGGKDMGRYASRGQARTLALTLRLTEAAYLHANTGQMPVVLLDDVLSELDPIRQRCVLSKTGLYEQVIISTTALDPILKQSIPGAVYFNVESGSVSRLDNGDYAS